MRYRFDQFELDTQQYTLHGSGTAIHVEPLVFDLLVFFIERVGEVVDRDTIIEHVWNGRIASDATVSSCIKFVRRALGDDGQQQTYVRTVRSRGFQFIASIESMPTVVEAPASSIEPSDIQLPSEADRAKAHLAPPKIAVLPLFALSLDPQLALLGDALSQEIILELSRLHWLFVVARGSSFKFRGQDVDLGRASVTLGAEYFLTGTILEDGDHCAIAVELCHAPDNGIIWADRFETPANMLMHMRSTIAAEIVGALESRIQQSEALQVAAVPTEQLNAWAAYHKGMQLMYRFNKRDNALAAQFFSKAVSLDPIFARAHAGLSFTHFQNAFLGFTANKAAEEDKYRHHAARSLELDSLDPFVNLSMGRAEWLSGNPEASLSWIERAIELRPNYAFAIYNSALLGTFMGEGAASEEKIEKAIFLSPIDPLNYAMLATRALSHLVRGNHATAGDWADRAIRSPNAHVQIFAIAAITHELAGNREKSALHVDHIRQMHPNFDRNAFLSAFPFRESALGRSVSETLTSLGF